MKKKSLDPRKVGQRKPNNNGYVFRKIDGILQSEHRAVWEFYNGPIPPGYYIHHINHIKTDNRIENLQCVSPKEHSLLHAATNKRRGNGKKDRVWIYEAIHDKTTEEKLAKAFIKKLEEKEVKKINLQSLLNKLEFVVLAVLADDALSKSELARNLGLVRTTLNSKMERLGIEFP